VRGSVRFRVRRVKLGLLGLFVVVGVFKSPTCSSEQTTARSTALRRNVVAWWGNLKHGTRCNLSLGTTSRLRCHGSSAPLQLLLLLPLLLVATDGNTASFLAPAQDSQTNFLCVSQHGRSTQWRTRTVARQSAYAQILVHGQVTIIFVVSVGLSACLFVCAEFLVSQPSLIRFRSN